MTARPLEVADLFCGAGGTSTGALNAIEALGRRANLVAINHWPVAVETHSANHINVKHACMSLEQAKPRELVPGRRLDLLVASPSCTHHSAARGGMPTSDQQRSGAWCVIHWATELRIKRILLENVPEFLKWGPVSLTDNRPLKSKAGQYFRAWVSALEALGYRVDWKILNAADYGDATTRKRLFIQAVMKPLKINWPRPTHARPGSLDIVAGLKPWRSARDIIDWSLPSKSIFTRKRPLAPKTLLRIEAGLKKFGGAMGEAFIVVLRRHADGRPLDDPLPAITAGGSHIGLVEPMLLGQHGGSVARPVSQPAMTIAAGGAISMIEPIVVNMKGRSDSQEVDRPLPTMTAHARHLGVAQPFVMRVNDAKPRPPIDARGPLPTLTTVLGLGVCEPFVVPYYGTGVPDDVSDPLATVTAKARFGLCEPSIANDDRVPTVQIDGAIMQLDIRFRMLESHELAAATGFSKRYDFKGTKAEVNRQIGNAVPVGLATELIGAMLSENAR